MTALFRVDSGWITHNEVSSSNSLFHDFDFAVVESAVLGEVV